MHNEKLSTSALTSGRKQWILLKMIYINIYDGYSKSLSLKIGNVEVIVLELEHFYISFSETIMACFVRRGSGHDILQIMCKTYTSVRVDNFFL